MLHRRSRTRPDAPGRESASPEPPAVRGGNNLVVVVLDSLRYDAFMAADTPNANRLGTAERRFSYASWTAPSHYNLLMGLLPHSSPEHVYASEYYKEDIGRYAERLGIEEMSFKELLPSIFLPTYLKHEHGYYTAAHVSMPVLNPATVLNRDFDHYELMPSHNDFGAIVDALEFPGDRPSFHLLNVGETHYPYALPTEDPSEWPRVSGVHGVLKRLDDDSDGAGAFFDDDQLAKLRRRQIDAASHCDRVLSDLFDACPKDTWFVVTADHGELFGEAGYFGHGPIQHEKVLEVPFVEGRLR